MILPFNWTNLFTPATLDPTGRGLLAWRRRGQVVGSFLAPTDTDLGDDMLTSAQSFLLHMYSGWAIRETVNKLNAIGIFVAICIAERH